MSTWLSMLKAVAVASADPRLGADGVTTTVTEEDAAAIRTLVRGQLAAFRSGDVDKAWAACSPGLQETLEHGRVLLALVEQKYTPLSERAVVTFGELDLTPDGLAQAIVMTDDEGEQHHVLYLVEPGESGWKVNGCVMLPCELPLAEAA